MTLQGILAAHIALARTGGQQSHLSRYALRRVRHTPVAGSIPVSSSRLLEQPCSVPCNPCTLQAGTRSPATEPGSLSCLSTVLACRRSSAPCEPGQPSLSRQCTTRSSSQRRAAVSACVSSPAPSGPPSAVTGGRLHLHLPLIRVP